MQFPQTTRFDKRIPKQTFYENMSVTPAMKRIFVEQIHSIVWKYKIAPSTTTLQTGKEVAEIEIFEIALQQKDLDISVMKQIDKAIPYHIIYFLTYEDNIQVWIRYKDSDGSLTKYFHTDWISKENIILQLTGINLDEAYENFVRQIGSIEIKDANSLKEQIVSDDKQAKLNKEIARLEKLARTEKQPKKKFELVQRVKQLRRCNKFIIL